MLKTVARMEYTIEGRKFDFTCENDAPIAHVKDALMKFIQCAGHIEDQVSAAQKAQAEKAMQAEAQSNQPELDIKPE